MSHERKHSGEKLFQCPECDFKTAWKISLTAHARTHADERLYACDQCDFQTKFKCSLTKHLLTHLDSSEKPFKCTECDYTATRQSLLEAHFNSKHRGEKPFKCDQCDFAAAAKTSLYDHKRNIHSTGERKYKCDRCVLSVSLPSISLSFSPPCADSFLFRPVRAK